MKASVLPPQSIGRLGSKVAFDRMAILLVILAGVVSALHVGKGPIAMPDMQRDFGLDLATLSWVMSVFAIIGLLGGMAAGVLAQRLGDRQVLVAGLLILGAASLVGAIVPSYAWLIASRVVEGLGFLLVVVAAPATLNRLTPPDRRSLVFGFWGTFMGVGIALSMLLGPMLGGWHRLWLFSGALALAMALWLAWRIPRATPRSAEASHSVWADVGRVLRSRPSWVLALAFAVYNLQFFALMTFLPNFLMAQVGLSVAHAGVAGAVIVLANAAGNVLGGLCLQRGVGAARLMVATFCVTGVLGVLIFLPGMPGRAVIALCVAFSAVAGVLPATFLASAPRAAPVPDLAPMSMGLVMQGNYLGQVGAPVLVGALLTGFGWIAVGLQIGVAALLGIALALCYGKPNAPGSQP